MVQITTTNNSFEAELIKGRLASEGIDSFLTNQNMNQLYAPVYSSFTTIGVMVRKEDAERAIEILNTATEK